MVFVYEHTIWEHILWKTYLEVYDKGAYIHVSMYDLYKTGLPQYD